MAGRRAIAGHVALALFAVVILAAGRAPAAFAQGKPQVDIIDESRLPRASRQGCSSCRSASASRSP
jgi:hypothetical protein